MLRNLNGQYDQFYERARFSNKNFPKSSVMPSNIYYGGEKLGYVVQGEGYVSMYEVFCTVRPPKCRQTANFLAGEEVKLSQSFQT